jgi:hypothetical protein
MHIGFARMMYPFCRSITFFLGWVNSIKENAFGALVIIALAIQELAEASVYG